MSMIVKEPDTLNIQQNNKLGEAEVDEWSDLDKKHQQQTKSHTHWMFIITLWITWGFLLLTAFFWFVSTLHPPWAWIACLDFLNPDQLERIQVFFAGLISTKVIQQFANKIGK